MIRLLPSIFSILITTEFILGNFASGFIALVNCIDWIKRQKLSSADQILMALAVSRIGFLCVILINWYTTVLHSVLYSLKVRIIFRIAWTVSNHFSIWLATNLSIFYLVKIANFSSLIFLYLKQRVKSVLLVMLLLGSLVFLVSYLAVLFVDDNMQTTEYEENITQKTKLRDMLHLSNMTLFMVVNFIPFTMSLTSFLRLIISLWKHLKKMQLNGKGSQDPSTKVHVRAVLSVVSFLLLYACHFLTIVIFIWASVRPQNELVLMLCEALAMLYPLSHSFILIWGNKKLRQAFKNIRKIIRLTDH